MRYRSLNVPGSPSAPLQTRYFVGQGSCATLAHFTPVEKPPPPRPRRPDFLMSAMIRSRVIASALASAWPPVPATYSSRDSIARSGKRRRYGRLVINSVLELGHFQRGATRRPSSRLIMDVIPTRRPSLGERSPHEMQRDLARLAKAEC